MPDITRKNGVVTTAFPFEYEEPTVDPRDVRGPITMDEARAHIDKNMWSARRLVEFVQQHGLRMATLSSLMGYSDQYLKPYAQQRRVVTGELEEALNEVEKMFLEKPWPGGTMPVRVWRKDGRAYKAVINYRELDARAIEKYLSKTDDCGGCGEINCAPCRLQIEIQGE